MVESLDIFNRNLGENPEEILEAHNRSGEFLGESLHQKKSLE